MYVCMYVCSWTLIPAVTKWERTNLSDLKRSLCLFQGKSPDSLKPFSTVKALMRHVFFTVKFLMMCFLSLPDHRHDDAERHHVNFREEPGLKRALNFTLKSCVLSEWISRRNLSSQLALRQEESGWKFIRFLVSVTVLMSAGLWLDGHASCPRPSVCFLVCCDLGPCVTHDLFCWKAKQRRASRNVRYHLLSSNLVFVKKKIRLSESLFLLY